jgi:hypothetical protein
MVEWCTSIREITRITLANKGIIVNPCEFCCALCFREEEEIKHGSDHYKYVYLNMSHVNVSFPTK